MTIDLPKPSLYCPRHPLILGTFTYAKVLSPDGQTTNLSQADLAKYGIVFSKASLNVESSDESLFDHELELGVYVQSEWESSWFIEAIAKIVYKQPPCKLTQAEIDAMPKAQLNLNVTKGLKSDSKSLKEVLQLGRDAMQATKKTYCGELEVAYVDQSPFLTVDLKTENVTLSSDLDESFVSGTYKDTSIEFTY